MDRQHGDRNSHEENDDQSHGPGMYLRFGAMILTGMVVMYAAMFVSTWEWSYIRLSESRIFMALTMGGAMGVVMLGWMLNMYRNTGLNLAVVAASIVLLAVGAFLDRSQALVGDSGFHELDDPASLHGDHPIRARPTRERELLSAQVPADEIADRLLVIDDQDPCLSSRRANGRAICFPMP